MPGGDPIVLWDEVNKRLPVAQDPTSRQARKALFKSMLHKGKKELKLDELQKGMKTELRYDMAGSYVPGIQEMSKTIKLAFKASCELAPPKSPSHDSPKVTKSTSAKIDTGVDHRKSPKSKHGKDKEKGGVDKREFHAFLLALGFYLEIAEFFEQCDGGHDDDQKLSCREVLKGTEKLAAWDISEDEVREKFSDVDPWVASMKFDDFSDWIMSHRMDNINLKLDDSDDDEVQYQAARATVKEGVDLTFSDLGAESQSNMMKVKEKFQTWDSDNSGGISCEEMANVMKNLNPDFTDKKVKLLFQAADVNNDGMIDIDEFMAFIFQ